MFRNQGIAIALWLAAGIAGAWAITIAGAPAGADGDPAGWVIFLGRFHPLVVHFPIAAAVLALGFDVASRWRRTGGESATALLWVAALSAAAAAVAGTLLASGGGYGEALLARHRWSGIGLAAILWAALGMRLVEGVRARGGLRTAAGSTWVLLAANGLMGYAAHQGGSLTHGSTYLTEYAPDFAALVLGREATPEPAPPAGEQAAFAQLVLPVLDRHCVSCHGPDKSKGGLRLDSHQGMLAGGEHGPAMEPGRPEQALILERVRLPETHRHAMPPLGRPRLSAEEIDILSWWIASGLSAEVLTAEAEVPGEILAAAGVAADQAAAAAGPGAEERARIDAAVARLREHGFTVLPATETAEDRFAVTAFEIVGGIDDADLEALAPLASFIVELNLARSEITDAGAAAVLPQFQRLERLRLDQTAVGDRTLAAALALPELREAGFHSTRVGDGALAALADAPRLESIHLWNTAVSTGAVENARQASPGIEISL